MQGGKLNVGGQQLRLRNGIPPTKAKNVVTDLDAFPAVPACSILVRLLPAQQVLYMYQGIWKLHWDRVYIWKYKLLTEFVKNITLSDILWFHLIVNLLFRRLFQCPAIPQDTISQSQQNPQCPRSECLLATENISITPEQ